MNRQRTESRQPGSKLTIGKLAQAAGVSLTTVRYYQRRGLLHEPAKPWGGVRHYGEKELQRLWLIRYAKELGFTLTEIVSVIDYADRQDCRGIKAIVERKWREVTRRIRLLNKARRTLKALLDDCRPGMRTAACPAVCPIGKFDASGLASGLLKS